MRLAVIPARGGSKRTPRKNVRTFAGRPMIAWPIETALFSGVFDAVIVSTDDAEIISIAEAHGATIPFRRPAQLADDLTPTRPVVRHAIEAMEALGVAVRQICCLYATTPFITAGDLVAGLSALETSENGFSVSVTHYAHPIQRALRLHADGTVVPLDEAKLATRSQDLEEMVHDAGAFYWGTRDAFMSERSILASGSAAVVLPTWRVCDIDTEDDWTRAELMFQAMFPNGKPDQR
ncbi:pseudaminic acid cytidylyltransferase [Shinella sp. M31]|uniref:pseudaminic acid cytidylyltransferase n=1 Tax=Shinella sp. M31 TaxID=3368615 RepID=UPI003BA12F84